MKTDFITSDLRTTEDVDWAGSLKGYLTKLYGNVTDFTKEVNIINKLRLDVTNSTHDAGNYEQSKNLYYKYYGQLELLDLRLPFQEHGVKIKFRWYDAYDDSTHHSQRSLAFEKASILFNLGAILSKLAESEFHQEDFAKSYQHFQYAAGIYLFISENFLHSPSYDLSVKTVQFLKTLQLAQAQEVFLLKLINEDSSKKSLIARLSIASSQQYERTQESMEKIDEYYGETSYWNQMLKFKTRFYLNLGYYNYALSIEEKKVGLAIAVLKVALEGFKDLKKYENPTTIDFKTYISLVEDKIRVLAKDNDFIYHETVPVKETIELDSLVKPLDASKPIALNDHANIGEIIGEDIFEKIIPTGVHEKLSLYSEEKANILREQLDKIEMVNIELESFLEYLRLPQSLNDFKNTNNNKLDPKVVDWSREVVESSLNDVSENRRKIATKREEILNMIKVLDNKLKQEEDDFNDKRSQLNSLQEPSTLQSANLKDELTNAKQSLLSATKLDNQIDATIEPELERLEILKSKQNLEREFFNSGSNNENLLDDFDEESTSTDKVNKSIAKIEEDLKILRDLKKERESVLEELKTAAHEDDISNILVLNNKSISDKEEKALFKQELKKFDSFIKKIDIINSKQPEVIKNIKIHYEKIITSNNKISEKAQKIASFETTFNTFKEYQINYGRSIQFYDNLSNFVYEVRSNIDKFVSDRYSQRQRILSQSGATSGTPNQQWSQPDALQERFKGMSVSSQSPRGSLAGQSQSPQQPPYTSNSGYSSFSGPPPQPSKPVQPYQQPAPAPQQPSTQPWTPTYEVPRPHPHSNIQSPYFSQFLQQQEARNQPSSGQPRFQPPQNNFAPPLQEYAPPRAPDAGYNRPALPPKSGFGSSQGGYQGYTQPYDPSKPWS